VTLCLSLGREGGGQHCRIKIYQNGASWNGPSDTSVCRICLNWPREIVLLDLYGRESAAWLNLCCWG